MKPSDFKDVIEELLGISGHSERDADGHSVWVKPDDDITIRTFESSSSDACDNFYISISIKREAVRK